MAMAKTHMAQTAEDISYTVLALEQTGWQSRGRTQDMFAAMAAAEQLFATKKFEQVKVDKEFLDRTNRRLVTTTILSKGNPARRPLPILVWLLVALIGGVASFAITYAIAHGVR